MGGYPVDLSPLRGGIAFLTRLPVDADEQAWRRFQEVPAAFPAVGYLVGAIAAVPFFLLDGEPAAAAYLLALLAVVGIAHLDGVADLGDAAAVHAGERRHEVLKDTTVGVGAVVAVAAVIAWLILGAVAVARLPPLAAVGIVVAAEVGAKLGMATVACLGTASHDGLGASFTRSAEPALLAGPLLVALPAVILAWPSPAALFAVLAGPAVAVGMVRWADRALGGVNGDVFGAVNELSRVLGLYLGVIAWTLF